MNLQCETLAVQGREPYFDVDSQLYSIPQQWNFWGKVWKIRWFTVFLSIEIRRIGKKLREGDVYCLFVRFTKFYTEEWKVSLI